MSFLRRGIRYGSYAVLTLGLLSVSSSAQAQGWNPLSVFKKKTQPAYRSVMPASAQLPIAQTPKSFPGMKPTVPNLQIPSFGGGGQVAPANFVDKWNQGAANKMDQVKKALTLPKLKMPGFDGQQFRGPQVQNENPFLKPLLNKLPFGNAKPAQPKKSLFSGLLGMGKPQMQQPRTLQEWQGLPRPQ